MIDLDNITLHNISFKIELISEPPNYTWAFIQPMKGSWEKKFKYTKEFTLICNTHCLIIHLYNDYNGKTINKIILSAKKIAQKIKSDLENEGFIFSGDIEINGQPQCRLKYLEMKGVTK